jgi:signal transduction histidine kinase
MEALSNRIDVVARTLGSVSHSVAGPLQSALNRIFVLRKKVAKTCPATAQALSELESEFQAGVARLEQLFELPRTAYLPGHLDQVAITDLAGAAATLAGANERVVITVRPATASTTLDQARVSRAIAELIVNALESSDDHDPVNVTIGLAGGMLTCDVADRGRGGWPRPPELAFDPFYTSKPRSLGLGLTLAYRVAAAAGGEIRITPGESGTVVSMRLPLQEPQ